MEPRIENSYGDEWTWTLPSKAQGVLMNAYSDIPGQFDHYSGSNFLDVATDNAVLNDFGSDLYTMSQGGLTAFSNPLQNWGIAYNQFRNINLFLENGLGENIIYYLADEQIDGQFRMRLKGEAHFLRAWWGMELLKVYGGLTDDGEALGYPIITRSIGESDKLDVESQSRNTYEECVAQIISDLDTAIAYLPFAYTLKGDAVYSDAEVGRATQKAAFALRSRVYTYAASPAFQPESEESALSVEQKWIRAALAGYTAVVEGQLGDYSALSEKLYNDVATTPDEFLFRKYHNNRTLELRNLPPYLLGAGRTCPSQNLVDAFPAANGYPIAREEADYDPQNPYVNRDPRLLLTVYYNGIPAEEDGRPLEIYYDVEKGKPGLDAPGYNYQNTRSGYYLRKWLSRKPEMLKVGELQNDFHQHALLRRAEIYFNWAEASNEAVGPEGIAPGTDRSAADIIRDIRKKTLGISTDPYLDEVVAQGKEAFRKLIQNERRIEFAFENHRYFDMRRWKMPLNESVRGVKIEKTSDGIQFLGTNPDGELIEIEKRQYNGEKYYYSPLPYAELIRNPHLKNNRGWNK
ncbi:RagB/SusD family nutrient uptake outer membrane protein [Mariniphaga anaerophila]|uniref:RagB/SusD family nutrient uptake outer membrane protein n=1 Tax=Mariniphaga anaerophila TaxID=1484053 RepID=UPI0015871AD5|nr:RagB/SusD family nutrient uptake outer membrane protein [Mariniphaga anaerophila]